MTRGENTSSFEECGMNLKNKKSAESKGFLQDLQDKSMIVIHLPGKGAMNHVQR